VSQTVEYPRHVETRTHTRFARECTVRDTVVRSVRDGSDTQPPLSSHVRRQICRSIQHQQPLACPFFASNSELRARALSVSTVLSRLFRRQTPSPSAAKDRLIPGSVVPRPTKSAINSLHCHLSFRRRMPASRNVRVKRALKPRLKYRACSRTTPTPFTPLDASRSPPSMNSNGRLRRRKCVHMSIARRLTPRCGIP
jgi:hypothetical protein